MTAADLISRMDIDSLKFNTQLLIHRSTRIHVIDVYSSYTVYTLVCDLRIHNYCIAILYCHYKPLIMFWCSRFSMWGAWEPSRLLPGHHPWEWTSWEEQQWTRLVFKDEDVALEVYACIYYSLSSLVPRLTDLVYRCMFCVCVCVCVYVCAQEIWSVYNINDFDDHSFYPGILDLNVCQLDEGFA